MTILEVWCELVCNSCAVRSNGTWCFTANVPRARLLELAPNWKFHNGEAYCPNCAHHVPEAKPKKPRRKVVINDRKQP